jgi:hypothetical protein
MFDIVADLTSQEPSPLSPIAANPPTVTQKTGHRLTIQIPSTPVTESQLPAPLLTAYTGSDRRPQSLKFTPTPPVFCFHQEKAKVKELTGNDGDGDAWKEAEAVQVKAVRARAGRERNTSLSLIRSGPSSPKKCQETIFAALPSFWSLMRSIYPTIFNKPIL